MSAHWKAAAALSFGLLAAGTVAAGPAFPDSGASTGSGSTSPPAQAAVCGAPAAGRASCHAVQLLNPSQDWHPGPTGRAGGNAASLPGSGYYPGDLQSAYQVAAAASAITPGAGAPTIAIVDAYDDPNALSDLTAYRTNLSGATDPNTGLSDGSIPPVCGGAITSGCITFTKYTPQGTPSGNTNWSEEISLDLDMVSAICPNCNIALVEAASNSFTNLAAATSFAKGLGPAAVTNSYGGNEFSGETSYNSTYAAGTTTAVTASTGDSGYGVEFPAADPNTTAVGGTSLTYTGTGSGLVWNAQTVWSSAGSGCSSQEGLPTWQNVSGVYNLSGTCAGRQVGDVAAVADPSTGVAVYDTYGLSGWTVFGGTSASAQIIGAMYGLAAGSVRAAPSALYPDQAGTGKTGPTPGLVPVKSGRNGRCGTYLCNAADSLSSGYNGPTGLGTPMGIGVFSGTPPAPDFSISAAPASETVTQGTSGSYTVTVTPIGGYAGTVKLSVSGAPTGTASFNPASVSTSGWQSTLTVPTSTATTPTSYPLTITGTDSSNASLAHSTGATLVVQAPQTGGAMNVTLTSGQLTRNGPNFHVPLTVTASDAGTSAALGGASVTLQVWSGTCGSGPPAATGSGTTNSSGVYSTTFSTRTVASWCAQATVSASGYTNGTSNQQPFST